MTAQRAQRQQSTADEIGKILEGPPTIVPPTVEPLQDGLGYRAHWAAIDTAITIEDVRRDRTGELQGLMRVQVGPYRNGEWSTLSSGRLVLASTSNRDGWERRLRNRWSHNDWAGLLDSFCDAIMRAERNVDRPAILMRDAPAPAAEGHTVFPLGLANHPTMWYGPGGDFKSMLALAYALTLHTGQSYVGGLQPAQTLRVGYVDFEFDAWEHRERMRRILRLPPLTAPDDMPDLVYVDCKGYSLPNQVERLQRIIRDHRLQYLIIDSVAFACEGKAGDDDVATSFFRALGQLKLPSLLIAHVAKNGDQAYPFGSVFWYNGARLIWYFSKRAQEPGRASVMLTNRKGNTGPKPKPLHFTLEFGVEGIRVVTTSIDEQEEQETLAEQMEALLRKEGRPMTFGEIALTLGRSELMVRKKATSNPERFPKVPPLPGSKRGRIAFTGYVYPHLPGKSPTVGEVGAGDQEGAKPPGTSASPGDLPPTFSREGGVNDEQDDLPEGTE